MRINLPIDINTVKGFLDPIEGEALYLYAKQYVTNDPCLEIGSYCGKSSVYLGSAVKENGQKLYSIDHHKGSEEQQPGEEYFDSDLINAEGNGIDTLPFFLETIEKSKLDKFVIPIVSTSEEAYQDFTLNFDMVFIDGGHSEKAAQKDYELWSQRITKGGLLAIHDVFPNPEDGGRPPYNIYRRALESGNFKELEMIKTLVLLKKI
jgi:predicted O-methyltransferase YrrM